MTITDVPTEAIELDETQVLFQEAKQRRRRRGLPQESALPSSLF